MEAQARPSSDSSPQMQDSERHQPSPRLDDNLWAREERRSVGQDRPRLRPVAAQASRRLRSPRVLRFPRARRRAVSLERRHEVVLSRARAQASSALVLFDA